MTLHPLGFTYDGAAYHSQCFPEGVDPNDEEVGAVFEWEEAALELTCDVCFEPLLDSEWTEEDS